MTDRLYFIPFIALSLFLRLSGPAYADEIEMLNRPANAGGLTGLLVTTSPYTIPAGRIETGFVLSSEDSNRPGYTLSEYSALAVIGLNNSMELSVKGSFFHREDEHGIKARAAGDTDVSWKWNIMPGIEDSPLPVVSVFFTGAVPTGDDEKIPTRVRHWGGKLGLSAGYELSWDEHAIGIYADAQISLADLSDESARDIYHLVNAGLIFPISKYRNLQLILEYNLVSGRDRQTIDPMDYTAVTSGIRLVTERFNLSMGMQLLHKEKVSTPLDDSSRLISIMSIKF